jgi:hypothetical protein
MAQVRKPIPKTPAELVQERIVPYDPVWGKQPPADKQNRAEKVSVKGSRDKDFSVKLIDIDTAIIEHINNNIQPTVYENGELLGVPVIYAFPERWVAIQKDGYLRDNAGKIMSPLIVVNRTDVQKNRNISRNLDSNLAQNVHIFEKTYTAKNAYDNFSILQNRVPVKEISVVAHPDYVTVTYELNVYANFMEQLNRIIEALQYAENSYWGDKNRYYFRVNIDTFPSVVSYTQGEERTVSSKLSVKLHGYLIPDTINAYLSKNATYVTKGQIIFDEQIIDPKVEILKANKKAEMNTTPPSPPEINPAYLAAITTYLNTTGQDRAIVINTTQAVLYNKKYLIAPPGLPPTNKFNFTIFINGVNVDDAYFNIAQNGNDMVFTFDTVGLGYDLVLTDDVLVIGKFS